MKTITKWATVLAAVLWCTLALAQNLFVSAGGNAIYEFTPDGTRSIFATGFIPQGLAFDIDGNLYVAASLSGKRGIVKITPDAKASVQVSGQGLVGLAFAPGKSAVLATNSAVHRISWNIQGLQLIGE